LQLRCPFGRRIYKTSSAGTSIYAYDEDNLIEEANSSGVVVARYEDTQNIDAPLAMLRSGSTSYYHADGLGSVTSLSNAAGSIANTYTYDSFGKLTNSTGSPVNPFRYTARESDTETGLYYYRARYYDQVDGRFLSEDPICLKGGINFYRYVRKNPLLFSDPTGLTGYQGFPADKLALMQLAVQAVKDRVNSNCPSCAGIDKAGILAYLDRATFVYNANFNGCGNSNGLKWFSNKIEISDHAFGAECCFNGPSSNALPSTLLHEVFHLIYFPPREDNAYALEKKCFGCQDPR
jgi:RHS repeat-associated protein